MICPKCGFTQLEDSESCQRCGVIFAKLAAHCQVETEHSTAEYQVAFKVTKESGLLSEIKARLFQIEPEEVPLFMAGRALFYLFMLIWGWRFIASSIASGFAMESWLHLINLPFHEAGHVILGLLGNRFIQVLGGTLGQLLMPAVVIGAFVLRRNLFGASVGIWWLGQSFMDAAIYANDARAGRLPLLGGVTGSEVEDYHDWEVMLGKLGWLQYDHAIARFLYGFGTALMVLSLAWGGYILWRQWRQGAVSRRNLFE
jgi:hypothetical protein